VPERGAKRANIEVEWQLDALDLRPVERWLATFPKVVPGTTAGTSAVVSVMVRPVKRTVDVYLDTADWRIGRSGFVLRVRHDADQGEVTLKDTTPAVAGLRRRVEVSEPLPAAGLQGLDPEGPVGRRLRALAGDAPLVQLLEIRTRRRPHQLRMADEVLGEADLDDTIIVVGDDQYPVRIRRIEVEAEAEWVDLLAPLVDQMRRECGLQPAILSKFEAGLLAAGLQIPEIPDLGPTTLAPEPTVGAVAYAVLRRNLGSMLAHEAGTRLGEDIEQLHDMRVATRRLRAALALFAGVLPGHARRLRSELGWLADELGAVRDLDVQLQRLDGWIDELPEEESGALTDLARLLGRERQAARESMLRSLDSPRYDGLVAEFTAMVRPGAGQGSGRQVTAAEAPAAVVVPGLVVARHRSVVTAARRARRSHDPADYHRLRIRCKRLRYALEFVSEIYDGQTRGVIRRVVRLQDCLGLIQDAQVAAGRLHALATAGSSGLSAATVFAMGSVAERYRRDAEHQATALPGYLASMKDSRWRKLRALMERRRAEVGPPNSRSPDPSSPTDTRPGDVAGRSDAGRSDDGRSDEGGRGGASGRGDASGPGEPSGPPAWSRSSLSASQLRTTSEDDHDWDDVDAPGLHSVPEAPPVTGPPPVSEYRPFTEHLTSTEQPTFPDGPRTPAPPAPDEPVVRRRRKEPVFLPPSGSPTRPDPARPAPRSEPPDEESNRSSFDRP